MKKFLTKFDLRKILRINNKENTIKNSKKNIIETLIKLFLIIRNLIILIFGIIIVYSIPAWFIMSNQVIEPLFAKILNIEVEPSISGGIKIGSFFDDIFDDYGDGSYSYPLNKYFNEKNICDITSYEVYRPVIDSSLLDPLAYWQVSISFSKTINEVNLQSGFSNIQVAIYIDIDGVENGSSITYFENAENIAFPDEHKWDILIMLNGLKKDKATLYYSEDIIKKYKIKNYNKEKGIQIISIFVPEQNKFYIHIPLDNLFIQKVLDGRKTYHWVLAGLHDIYGNGGWLNVKEEPTLRYGGGLKWENGPKVYDIVVPSYYNQKELLSKENKSYNDLVVIPPLISNGFNPNISYHKENKIIKNISKIDDKNNNKINELMKKIEEEEKLDKEIFEKELIEKLNSSDQINKLFALFAISKFDEADKLAQNILNSDPENPVALAYKGSLIAMEAGNTKNPMQAITLVNKAYEYLDKAVLIIEKNINKKLGYNNIINLSEILDDENKFKIFIENEANLIDYYLMVLSNRAIVSSSVPDEIFNKLEIAISDFNKIAKLYKNMGKVKEYSFTLMHIAILLEKKGKKDEANVFWFTLSKIDDLPAKIKLELIKRGFLNN